MYVFPSQLVFWPDKVKHQLIVSTYLVLFSVPIPPKTMVWNRKKWPRFFFPWGTSFKKRLKTMENPWKKHGHASHIKPTGRKLGCPSTLRSTRWCLTRKPSSRALRGVKRRYQPVGDRVGGIQLGKFTKKLKHPKGTNLHFERFDYFWFKAPNWRRWGGSSTWDVSFLVLLVAKDVDKTFFVF